MDPLDSLDFFTPANYGDGFPHGIFARLRAEDPVHWTAETYTSEYPFVTEPGPGLWAVTRHADVDHVLRSPKTFSSHVGATFVVDLNPEPLAMQQRQMLNMDAPEHSRLRRIVNRAFTPRAVDALRDSVATNTATILDAAPLDTEIDFVTSVAAELPLMMLCGLLGVPLEDRFLLFDWTNRLTDVGTRADLIKTLTEMGEYCDRHSAAKRANPSDDVWSTLVNAELPEEDGDGGSHLSDEDLRMFWQLLVVAGNDTTRNSISGAVRAFAEHPAQAQLLREDLDRIPNGVEEILRWVSPVNHFRRTAVHDTELGGKTIRAGDKVVIYYTSANRDSDVFEDPFRFDVTRTPNRHLAFGVGPHFCLGAPLARLQLRTMVAALLERFAAIEITGDIDYAPITFISAIQSMPVRLRR